MSKKNKLLCYIIVCLFILASWIHSQDKERIIIQTPFKPIKTVYPDYPEELMAKGVGARIVISIHMDSHGKVQSAMAWNSLYPEIAKTLEKTFSQWEFEPYIHEKEPISISGFIMVIYFPGKLIAQARSSDAVDAYRLRFKPPENKKLQMILDRCAEYCMELSESALYYVCDEEIREKTNAVKGPKYEVSITPPHNLEDATIYGMNYNPLTIRGSEKHMSVYGYQVIRKQGQFSDKRILIKKDSEKGNMEGIPREIIPSYNLKPILIPNQILGIENRAEFSFKLLDEKKIKGRAVYLMEASLRPEIQGNIKWAKIWMDKIDFRIIKIEMETEFIPGFESILSECYRYYLKPHFRATYTYEVDKKGLLFPKKAEIKVEYSGFLRAARKLKSDVSISYKNYKFFTVKTDHDVIKKKLRFLLLDESKLPIMRLWK